MLFALLGISLLFIAVGLFVNEHNAKYVLSGYNTMSEAERQTVDIQSMMPVFKKFHLILGASLFAIGSLFYFLISESAATIFLAVYPITAYLFYFFISRKYYRGASKKKQVFAMIIAAAALIMIIGLTGAGNKSGNLIIQPDKIEFDGMYGEVLTPSTIKTVELVNQLPNTTMRTNGYALGPVRKGHFKTDKGEIIKLLVDTEQGPFILIEKKSGEKIYFGVKGKPMESIAAELKAQL